jgi:hypothetical protein
MLFGFKDQLFNSLTCRFLGGRFSSSIIPADLLVALTLRPPQGENQGLDSALWLLYHSGVMSADLSDWPKTV